MLKLKYIVICIIFSFFGIINAQKEANQWYFEQYNALDFNGDTVKYIDGCVLGRNESSSTFCDFNGQMMFYSNGITLYNKYNEIVKNGIDLGFPYNPNSTTSLQGTQLIKHPENDSLLYLFSSDFLGGGGGLVYAVIDIHGNNDSGEVIAKKIKLTGAINEPISAVNHQNGKDIWVICHSFGGDVFNVFLLTKNGIVNCPITTKIGFNHDSYSGLFAMIPLKFSPNGKFVSHSNFTDGNLEIFNFNNENGKINNLAHTITNNLIIGFEYSPNSNFIYFKHLDSGLYQYNLVTKKRTFKSSNTDNIAQLQLAPNGKIYIAKIDSRDLFVIDKPNKEGDSCNVIIKQNFLQNTNITAMPSFNQSYFYTPAINYTYEMNCIKNSIQFWGKDTFGASNHIWQVRKSFGVNSYSLIGSSKDINYTFVDTGSYEVRYVASNGNKADTVIKSIVLYDKIKKDFLGKATTYVQGDVINKTLFAPTPNHCVRWYFDKLSTGSFKEKGSSSSLLADSVGTYICKVTNQAFCEVWDTIVISECINNLNQPSLFRSRDTLRTFHLNADSFVWYKNNEVYKITKQPFLALTDTGTYRVEAAKKGHCNRSSVGQLMVNRLSVNGINIEDIGIRVFPNPSEGKISIHSQNPFKLKINTLLGQTIYEAENIDNIHLPKGIYFLHFDVGGIRSVEKVVVW